MNIDWNLLVASFSALAASVALFATYLGWKENRELRKAQTDPFVDVRLETVNHHLNFLRLKIMNIGKGGAFNLKIILKPGVSLDENLKEAARKVIGVFNNLDYMKNGVNYLPPMDSKYTRYINLSGFEKEVVSIDDFYKLILTAEVQYQDLNDKIFKRQYIIDASEFKIYKLGKIFEESVPESLDSIQNSLKKLNKSLNEQNKFLEEKNIANEIEWNEFELKIKLHQIRFIKEKNEKLGINNNKYNFKSLERKKTIHEMRKQNVD